ncbi:MAG: ABC transporter ATP-binding protein [Gaiellales bacterium]|nr:MAG: ABC transporter ATP-binding protein [Gaiellales bacterium]
MNAILEVQRVKRRYNGGMALAVEHLAVRRGETLCLMGPNGAGKSTLVRVLNLVEEPDEGRISFKGSAVGARAGNVRRSMAGVFQRPYLFRGSVADNVAYGLRLRRLDRREVERRAAGTMELLGLTALADHDARRLSGGEAQRVALARAIAVRPEVLFLDEPAANLDPHARVSFHADLRRVASRDDTTVIYVTHSIEEALATGDRIAIMRGGAIRQLGDAADVFHHPADRFCARFLGCENLLPGRVRESAAGAAMVELDRGGRLYTTAGRQGRVLACIRSEEVTLHHPSLPGELSRTANRLAAVVRQVVATGPLHEVLLDCAGFELKARVARPVILDLGLEPGQALEARFDESAVHLVADDEWQEPEAPGRCSRGVLLGEAFAGGEVRSRD